MEDRLAASGTTCYECVPCRASPSFSPLPASRRASATKEKKVFANLDGRAVWLRSAELFITRPDVCQCIVVIAPDDQELFKRALRRQSRFHEHPDGRRRHVNASSPSPTRSRLVKDEGGVRRHPRRGPAVPHGELIDAVFGQAAKPAPLCSPCRCPTFGFNDFRLQCSFCRLANAQKHSKKRDRQEELYRDGGWKQ